MSKRNRERAAQEAAEKASEAGRTLQAQREVSRETEQVEKDPVDTPRPQSRNEPRRLAMEEIEARDLVSKGLSEPKEEVVVPDNPPPPTAEQMLEGGKFSQAEPEPEEPETVEPTEPTPEMVKVKIDGVESEVLKSEVEEAGGVKSYQMQKASENRLHKTNEALSQVKQMQEAIANFARQQTPQQPQVTDAQFMASRLDAIRYGTPEEGAQALMEVQQRSNPRVDQNHLVNQAVAQTNYLNGVKKFMDEFSDVANSPLLMKLTETLARERISAIPADPVIRSQMDWSDFYRKIGNEVRGVVGRQSQPTPTQPTTGSTSQVPSDKVERKSTIVNLPTASARAELPKEAKPETRDDTLNSMRKARGFPTG